MKVAISSQGSDLSSQVDPRFGRARHFVVVDTESDAIEPFDNTQNLNAAQGAGIQAAANVAQLGVEAVITGHCGPNAFRGLAAAGIKVYVNASGTVAEAFEQMKAGKLDASDSPDVQGHWV